MKGIMTIKVTEHGYGIDCDFENVGPVDKVEFMHAISRALEMSDAERALYFMLDSLGALDDAASHRSCVTNEELEELLTGNNQGAHYES